MSVIKKHAERRRRCWRRLYWLPAERADWRRASHR